MADGGDKETNDGSSSASDIIEIKDYDERLDFFSDKFDPILALKSPGVEVPDSTAKKFDNLAAYKAAIDRKENPRENVVKKQQVTSSDASKTERRWKEHQMPVKSTIVRKKKPNLFLQMDQAKGPLALLKKCMDERLKIKVWTRNDKMIRGYCLAYLVAFDKFWNMILEDVTEYWSRLKKRKVPAFDNLKQDVDEKKILRTRIRPPKIKVFPHESDKKLESCVRHVDQLMIRGEQVVFVNVMEDKKSEDEKNENKLVVIEIEENTIIRVEKPGKREVVEISDDDDDDDVEVISVINNTDEKVVKIEGNNS